MHYPRQPWQSTYAAPGPANLGLPAPVQATAGPGWNPPPKVATPRSGRLVLEPPTVETKYFVRHYADGSFSEHTVNEINASFQPGHWVHSAQGFPYYVQLAPRPAT